MNLIICIILGAFFWTFLEYILHRFLGHIDYQKIRKSRFFKEHKKHHYIQNYFVNSLDKFIMALVLGVISLLGTRLILGGIQSIFFSTGLIVMYGIYEVIHRRLHTHLPKNRYGIFLRSHHFYHHNVNENMNHGVTSPIWDIFFGTFQKV